MRHRPSSTLLSVLTLAAALGPALCWAQASGRNFTVQPQAAGTATQQRVALVIGNNSYADAPLSNPLNDAKAVAKALETAGFQVILKLNANHKDMMGAVREFGSRLRQGGSGLFYFAGHGMQIKGRNYLIPVGADIQREDEVAYQAMDAQAVLDKMESAGNGTNLMILDACRNNPFARSFRSATQGLAQMEAPVGTLVAFATAPGSVSSDGSGQHGLYTEHLLRLMRAPGMKVEDVFKQVRVAVRKESQGKQIPWESTSLEGDFYFLPPRPTDPSPSAASPAAPPPGEAVEQAFWDSVKDSATPADLQAFLRRYPNSRHAASAQQRLQALSPPPSPVQAARPPAPSPAPVAQAPANFSLPEAGPRQSAQADAAVLAALSSPSAAQSVKPNTEALWPEAAPRLGVGARPIGWTPTAPSTVPKPAPASTANGYSVGDRWNFQVVDKWRGEVVRNYSTNVKQVLADGNWLTGGGTLMDPLARVLESPRSESQARTLYKPYQPRWWEDMQVGQRRKLEYQIEVLSAEGDSTLRQVVADIQVKARETVRVPAGEFEALRIEMDSAVDSRRGSQRWSNRWLHTYWYVPQLRYYAAMDIEVRSQTGQLERRDREELTSFEQRQGALALR